MRIKTGDTFRLHFAFQNKDGTPKSLAGYSIDIDLVEAGNNSQIGSWSIGSGITLTDEPGGLYTLDGGSTLTWPVTDALFDIRYSLAGIVTHSETAHVEILAGISRAG